MKRSDSIRTKHLGGVVHGSIAKMPGRGGIVSAKEMLGTNERPKDPPNVVIPRTRDEAEALLAERRTGPIDAVARYGIRQAEIAETLRQKAEKDREYAEWAAITQLPSENWWARGMCRVCGARDGQRCMDIHLDRVNGVHRVRFNDAVAQEQ